MKNAISISIAFSINILIRNKNITFKEHKTKKTIWDNLACRVSYKPSELGGQSKIEHSFIRVWPGHDFFDWVNHPTLRACNLPYMQDYFKRFFVLRSSEIIFSFLIKTSRLKAIEIETAFFHSLGNPKGRTLNYFFYASHINHNFPYIQTDTHMDKLLEIFLKLSTKTVQVHLMTGTTLVQRSTNMSSIRISKAQSFEYWLGFNFVLVVWKFLHSDACWTMSWNTPGPTSFSKFSMILFSECSVSCNVSAMHTTKIVNQEF